MKNSEWRNRSICVSVTIIKHVRSNGMIDEYDETVKFDEVKDERREEKEIYEVSSPHFSLLSIKGDG